jgi:hypothetical protein
VPGYSHPAFVNYGNRTLMAETGPAIKIWDCLS